MKKSLLIFILVLLMIGCGKNNKNNFIKDSYGNSVDTCKKYDRIVSIAPNITEIIVKLDGKNRLVGRSSYCNYPNEVLSIESIGEIVTPNFEKIVALQPELVITSTHVKKESVEKIKNAGIICASLYGGESFDGVYSVINDTAKLLNREKESEKLISEMKSNVEKLAKKTKEIPKKPKVYYMISYGKYGDYTAGKDTFISQLISIAGGENIANDVNGWKYGIEKIIEHNPDIIICSNKSNILNDLKNLNGYKELSAVKENKVYGIDCDKIDRQSYRVVEGLYDIAKILHPELFDKNGRLKNE